MIMWDIVITTFNFQATFVLEIVEGITYCTKIFIPDVRQPATSVPGILNFFLCRCLYVCVCVFVCVHPEAIIN